MLDITVFEVLNSRTRGVNNAVCSLSS